MNLNNSLVILDEYLENKSGHYYEYDKSVKELFEKHKIKVYIYANKNLSKELQNELQAQPYFNFNPNIWFRKIKILGSVIYRIYFWKTLYSQILKKTKQHQESTFFFPNIFWYNVLPIAFALNINKVKATILFRTSIIDISQVNFLFKPFIRFLYIFSTYLIKKNKNVTFTSDSQVIADEFFIKTQLNMKVLPIPHVFDLGSRLKNPKDTFFRIYLPGPARYEKGIELVVKSFEWINLNYPSHLKKIVFVCQFFGEKEKVFLEKLKEKLISLPHTTLFLSLLNSEEYKKEINKADIILLPYLNTCGYKSRTSGVLSEAIACSKPFISTKDSWMYQQSINFNTGSCFEDMNSVDLAQKIMEMTNNYSIYLERAKNSKKEWLNYHSKENFYKIFTKEL